MNVIELQNVKKNYPLGNTVVHAVKGVDLTIKGGDLLSIVGPSGSGKTTLLNIIGCIDQASEGSVTIHGEDIRSLNDRQLTDLRLHRIGFIFQTFNLIPVLTVRENVEFPLLLMKRKQLSPKEIRERVEQLVEEEGDDRLFREFRRLLLETTKEEVMWCPGTRNNSKLWVVSRLNQL